MAARCTTANGLGVFLDTAFLIALGSQTSDFTNVNSGCEKQGNSLYAGGGGTQIAGGRAGYYSSFGSGTAGTLGNGGTGAGGSGAGGGGGYYGGGGGVWAGGGGGSSYYDAAGNTDKSTTQGVRSGHGEIIFRY